MDPDLGSSLCFQANLSLHCTRRQILDSSKLKRFADDNFKFDENGRKLSKRVENTVGQREIARYEQFLLFPVFSKGMFPRGVKRCHCVEMGKPFTKQASVFRCLQYKSFENTVGKGEIARNELFLLFPQCFLPVCKTFCHFNEFEIVVCKLFEFGRVQKFDVLVKTQTIGQWNSIGQPRDTKNF